MAAQGRLPAGRAFDAVFRDGGSIQGPFFVLRFRPAEAGPARWGFAAGKRIDRRATVRNRIRRRLRAAARTVSVPAGDLVLIARPAALAAPMADLERELARLVAKIVGKLS